MSVFSDRLVIVLLISLFYCIDIVQCLQMKSSKLNMNLLNVSKPRTNTIQKKNYISVDNISNQKFRLVEVPEPHEIIETEIEFLPTGGINIREICQNSNRSKVTNSIVTRASWRSTYGDKNLLEMIIERTIQVRSIAKYFVFFVNFNFTFIGKVWTFFSDVALHRK